MFAPLTETDVRPLLLRWWGGRPQLKRDPLGATHASVPDSTIPYADQYHAPTRLISNRVIALNLRGLPQVPRDGASGSSDARPSART